MGRDPQQYLVFCFSGSIFQWFNLFGVPFIGQQHALYFCPLSEGGVGLDGISDVLNIDITWQWKLVAARELLFFPLI